MARNKKNGGLNCLLKSKAASPKIAHILVTLVIVVFAIEVWSLSATEIRKF